MSFLKSPFYHNPLIMGGDDEDARQTGVVLSAGDFISITWGSEKGAIRSADPDEFLLAG